jgi:hypothetical protein
MTKTELQAEARERARDVASHDQLSAIFEVFMLMGKPRFDSPRDFLRPMFAPGPW